MNTALFRRCCRTHEPHPHPPHLCAWSCWKQAEHSRALGMTCSIQMPWLQIKAGGERARWKPGRVTHIRQRGLHPRQLGGCSRLVGETRQLPDLSLCFLPALRSLPLSFSLSPLHVPRLIVAVSVGSSSSLLRALMGNVSTSLCRAAARSDRMTRQVMPLPRAVLSGHIG